MWEYHDPLVETHFFFFNLALQKARKYLMTVPVAINVLRQGFFVPTIAIKTFSWSKTASYLSKSQSQILVLRCNWKKWRAFRCIISGYLLIKCL